MNEILLDSDARRKQSPDIDWLLADGLADEAEACDELRCGRTKLWALDRDGQIRSVKLGGSRRWFRRSIRDYIARSYSGSHADGTRGAR